MNFTVDESKLDTGKTCWYIKSHNHRRIVALCFTRANAQLVWTALALAEKHARREREIDRRLIKDISS